MTDSRKKRTSKEPASQEIEAEPAGPTLDEIDVAIYLYDHLRNRDGYLGNKVVGIFKAIEAFDALKISPFSSMEGAKKSWFSKKPTLFNTDQEIFDFLTAMTAKGMFFKTKRPLKKYKNKDEDKDEVDKVREQSLFAPPSPPKRPKLTVQSDDQFIYGDHLIYYVWRFERPVTLKTWIYGILMLIILILLCFYPVWPQSLHSISWYFVMAGICFLCGLFILAIIRLVLNTVILFFTSGYVNFWIFPNLFEDCGFFASFLPVYIVKYRKKTTDKEKEE